MAYYLVCKIHASSYGLCNTNSSFTEMKSHEQCLFYYLICGLSMDGTENQCPSIGVHVLFYVFLSWKVMSLINISRWISDDVKWNFASQGKNTKYEAIKDSM